MLKPKVLLFLNSFWAIPLVLSIRLLKPIVLIRTGRFFSERIGHFIADTSEQLIRKKLQENKSIDIWSVGEIVNKQWFVMVSRNMKIFGSWARYLNSWNNFIPGGAKHKIPRTQTGSRDPDGLFTKHPVAISFLPEEDTAAKNWLAKRGWKEGEPFVCLLVRDDSYTLTLNPPPKDLNDCGYRNSDIKSYVDAIEYLTNNGVWVLRMGRKMSSKIEVNSQYVIDYSFDSEKSDLLDIWLFANCLGAISTGTGLDILCPIYGKPILYLNALPLRHINTSANAIWISKNLIWKYSGKPLSLTEYLNCPAMSDKEYTDLGIEINNLSSSEILLGVQEFFCRITDTWIETQDNLQLQSKFMHIILNWPLVDSAFISWTHPNFRVGARWLESKGELFLAD